MAFLLRFDGVDDRVTLPAALSLTTTGNYIELDVDLDAQTRQPLLGDKTDGFIGNIFERFTATEWRSRVLGGQETSNINSSSISGRVLLRLEKTSNSVGFYIDGVLAGSFGSVIGAIEPDQIGAWGGATSIKAKFDLYGLRFGSSSGIVHDYVPSGTGSTLIDTVGGNNGTLVNFPTDNSQWVSYGAPAVPTLSTPTATAVTSNSISFSIPVGY